jgi:hypothetical protein
MILRTERSLQSVFSRKREQDSGALLREKPESRSACDILKPVLFSLYGSWGWLKGESVFVGLAFWQ